MATLTAEITDDLQERLDREFATGRFKDRNDLVQILLETAIRENGKEKGEGRTERIDELLLEAVDQIDRGECAPWQPGEGRKILDGVIRRHQESVNQ